ncbi:WD-40 repeat-containing protein MSI4 [Glycine max]|nr:WD-40 repeat-containing protein MSI4 [Glycine max]
MGRRQREWKCLVLAGSLLGFLGQMGSSARASHFQEPSPSLSFRTGRSLTTFPFLSFQILLTLFLSSQTDGSVPNTLVKPRVAAEFNEEARSPFFKKYKTVLHPGEVNRIREFQQNSKIVATHTDCPEVLIWDVETQPNRHAVLGATTSRPDLVLTGHKDNAEFALAMCPTEPFILSGGWSLFIAFSSQKIAQEFCSVGDDSRLILWDARLGSAPVVKVDKAHNGYLHCVDWSPHDINFILTGSADNTINMFDRRNLTSGGVGSPIYKFEGHDAAVLCTVLGIVIECLLTYNFDLFQWSPDKPSVFGSTAEDGILNIWDHDKVGKTTDSASSKASNTPPGLFFRHAGHRYDIKWLCAFISLFSSLEFNIMFKLFEFLLQLELFNCTIL